MTDGRKDDVGKLRMGLTDPHVDREVAAVLTYGARKYAPGGWRHVPRWKERYVDALLRHMTAYRSGEVYDAESRMAHLAHVICCAHFLLGLEMREDEGIQESLPTRLAAALER